MKAIINLIISTVSVLLGAYLVPGVFVQDMFTALIVAVVLGTLNMFVKPILVLLTLPITVVTLGLFLFVINLGLIILTDYIVPGFTIETIWSAIIFGIIITLANSFLGALAKD